MDLKLVMGLIPKKMRFLIEIISALLAFASFKFRLEQAPPLDKSNDDMN